MPWYVTYRTAAGNTVRHTDTQGEAAAIARGLLAAGIDVRIVGCDDDGEMIGADEVRRLYAGVDGVRAHPRKKC